MVDAVVTSVVVRCVIINHYSLSIAVYGVHIHSQNHSESVCLIIIIPVDPVCISAFPKLGC